MGRLPPFSPSAPLLSAPRARWRHRTPSPNPARPIDLARETATAPKPWLFAIQALPSGKRRQTARSLLRQPMHRYGFNGVVANRRRPLITSTKANRPSHPPVERRQGGKADVVIIMWRCR